jgi:hypothetical protein
VHGRESRVCRMTKALYGLKQAPRSSYSRIDGYLLGLGFTKIEVDPNLYYTLVGDDPLILVLYVDEGSSGGNKACVEVYLQRTVDFGLIYLRVGGVQLQGYTDLD